MPPGAPSRDTTNRPPAPTTSGSQTRQPMVFDAAQGGWVTEQTPTGYVWDSVEGKYNKTPTAAGTAQGTGAGAEATAYVNALRAAGIDVSGGGSNSSTSSSTSGSTGKPYTPTPTVSFPGGSASPSPALAGLTAATGRMTTAPQILEGPSAGGAVSGGRMGHVAPVAPVDTSTANRAAFAAAKDQTGQVAQGALTGLRSALGGRGMLGSGAESRGTAAIVGRGAGELGLVSRQQAVNEAALREREAALNQGAATTQRSQDITQQGNELTAGTTQRGQTLESQTAANTLAGQNTRAGYEGAITQRGQDILAQQAHIDENARATAVTQATRQAALDGLIRAISGTGRSYV